MIMSLHELCGKCWNEIPMLLVDADTFDQEKPIEGQVIRRGTPRTIYWDRSCPYYAVRSFGIYEGKMIVEVTSHVDLNV